MESHELDELLEDQLAMIASIAFPWAAADVLPPIRAAVEQRLPQVETSAQLVRLIHEAANDEVLWPIVVRAIEGDRNDFGNLWMRVQAKVLPVIRRTVGSYGDEFVDRALDQTWETLESQLKGSDPEKAYSRDKGFFLTWARTVARFTAMSVRPRSARRYKFEGSKLPPRDPPDFACFNELVRLAQNATDRPEPHKVIAFLYNQYLGWLPHRIAEERGKCRLAVLPILLEQDVVELFPSLDGFGELLGDLRSQVATIGDKNLSDYCGVGTRLESAISHWSTDWARTVRNSLIQHGKKLLRLACQLEAPTHERLSFLWCRFLRLTPHRLGTLAEWFLAALLTEFCRRLETMTALEAQQIRRATMALRTEIDQAAPRRLGECARDDIVESIELWRNRIEAMLVGPARKEHVLAYSYLCGCLPGVARKAKALSGRTV